MVKTVGEFLKDAENLQAIKSGEGKSLKDAVLDATYIWTDAACVGYCLEAMEAAGIGAEDRGIVADYLYALFDTLSIREAERRGRKRT